MQDGGEVCKRHADQMITTGVGNGIEDEPVSMAVEPEWRKVTLLIRATHNT